MKCCLSNREVSFIFIRSTAGAAAALCYYYFLFLLRRHRVRFHNRNLDLIDYNYYTVRCCTWYDYVFVYTCLLCVVCCYIAFVAAAAVRHRVPGIKICFRGSLHLIPVLSISSFKHIFLMYPLAVLSQFQRRFFTYTIYHPRYYGHARSQGGR